MNDYNDSREVQNYSALPSTSSLAHRIPDNWIDHGIFRGLDDDFNQKFHSQPGDVNPEESLSSQTTSFLTDGSLVEGWRMSGHLELKTGGETAVIAPCDDFSGRPIKIVAPFDPFPSTIPVKEYSQDDDLWAQELDAYIFTLSNLRPDANSNDQDLKTIAAENDKPTLSMNVTNSLPNSQERGNFAKSTGEHATATFSADDCPPGPSSYSSVRQFSAASSWTRGPTTATGFFGVPPTYGQLPSYPPQSMGHAVVASDIPYHDQLIKRRATAPVAHFPMAGWHRGIYTRQPFTAPATVTRHWTTQIGGDYSRYNPVAQATVSPDIQPYAVASVPVNGANPLFTQAPIMGAFRVDKRQQRNSPPTTSAQAARREKRHNPDRPSCESEFYCQWGDCSKGPMTETKIFEHFRAHGEKIKESGRIKECKWAGCDPKPGAFPMTSDGFRRHVKETQSHVEIGRLTKVKCETCGRKRARRSMFSHRRVCSRESRNEGE